jgi:aminopeptidase
VSNPVNAYSETIIQNAAKYLDDILSLAIMHTPNKKALVVSDADCPLAMTLTEAYKRSLPSADFLDFYSAGPEVITATLETLSPSDLVVLIQSSSFRLNAFRLRVELFDRSIKVIEHPHLGRMSAEEGIYYIEALAYDADYYRSVGHALKQCIDQASSGVVDTGGEQLLFNSRFEPAKLNIGDYSQLKNIGGQFPIGEVFTEAAQLEAVSGRVKIFAFGDTSFAVHKPASPITLVITRGQVTDVINSVPEFDAVLNNIRADEKVVWLRELGFGLNRAFTKEKTVTDIGTYERMCGVHLSLGAKHTVYKKPGFTRSNAWHHVDVFADTQYVMLDDKIIYQNGKWLS